MTSTAVHSVNRFLEQISPHLSKGLQTTPGDIMRDGRLHKSGGDLAAAIGLNDGNGMGGRPNPLDPDTGDVTGLNPYTDPVTIDVVFYNWCQDIIGEVMSVQAQMRPEQVAASQKPNAKPDEQPAGGM